MAFLKISFVALAVVAAVAADVSHLSGVRNTYLPPSNSPSAPRPVYGAPSNQQQQQHEPGMPFDFSYSVNEDGNNFGHKAVSDGDVTKGEYRVLLPDGRTQIVRYTADWKNGYNAEVTYEGTASYPAPSNSNSQYGPPKNQYGGGAPSNNNFNSQYGGGAPQKVNNQYLPPKNQGGPY